MSEEPLPSEAPAPLPGGTVACQQLVPEREKFESLALLADVGLPLRAVRSQVAAAIDVVVSAARLRDGSRKLTAISEVLPLNEKGEYQVQDLFVFTQSGVTAEGKVQGYLSPTGILPTFHSKMIADGYDYLTEEFFRPQTYGYEPPEYFAGAKPKKLSLDTQPGVELKDIEGYDL